ncbi:MAG: sigma-70 family RNA polymerase sigma factor [Cellvibrionaceae bacterium]|nr:sigma-70 family RNA polymerase sigma factor [Cellvibrionaceae bacterium]
MTANASKANRLAVAKLYDDNQAALIRFLRFRLGDSSEAEDIAQDAFHNLIRSENADQLENPRAYLFQTAANLALNRIRKIRRQSNYQQLTEAEQEQTQSPPPEQTLLAEYDLAKVGTVLDTLPPKCRRAFILSRAQHMSYRQISEELDVAVSTVEKYLIRALKAMREAL